MSAHKPKLLTLNHTARKRVQLELVGCVYYQGKPKSSLEQIRNRINTRDQKKNG